MGAPHVWRSDPRPTEDWTPPAIQVDWNHQRKRRRSRRLIIGVPVLSFVLLIAVVAALGGFGKRTDRLITVPVGETITTGPLEYSFTRATTVQKESLGKQIHEVIVYGSARTSGTESMAPSSRQFVGRDNVDRLVQDPEIAKIGTAENYANGSTLTPGLPPVEFRVEFEFPESWQPSATFRIGVADLEHEDLFFGGEDPHWEPDASKVFQVLLPVQVLPAEK